MQAGIFTGSHAGIIIGAYIVLNLLALFLLDHWLCNSSFTYRNSVTRRVIVSFLFISVAALPVLALFIRDGVYKYYLERNSYIWMGFLMYFGALILVLSLIELIVRLIRRKRKGSDTDDESSAGSVAGRVISGVLLVLMIAASVAINFYGTEHARNIKVTRYTVPVNKTVKGTKNLRVGFISDLHLSYNSDVETIEKMVEKLNREKPDVVFVGGDMFSSNYRSVREPKKYIKALKKIKAKEGVYWIYGNHDVEEMLFCGFSLQKPEEARRTRKMKRFLKKSGFTVLADKRVAIAGGKVQVAGREDQHKPLKKAENRLDPGKLLDDLDKDNPIIVLEHEPVDFDDLAADGADVVFAGHTHAGQLFPGTIVTELMSDVAYGIEERNGMTIIVSSGVGCYGPPIRVLTDSEIVIADLEFK